MLTLQQIRDQSPCTEGWTKLLKALGHPPMDTVISLGDVAISNGAADACWCVRALDWGNEQVRREVIKALLPSVKRASVNTKDARVHNCISAIQDWIAGKPADLNAAARAAEAAWAAALGAAWVPEAAALAAEAAAQAASRVAEVALAAAWEAEAALAAARAAESALAAARAAEAAWEAEAALASEKDAQRADLIAAFPPLVLAGGKKDE